MLIFQNHSNYILMNVQNLDGIDWVIGYASRTLIKTKHKYLANKLEFLALKWVIMEKFHKYLYGNTFVVHTDNNLLTYILTSAKLDATGHCWVASLASYNSALSYLSGKMNVDVEALSHILRRSMISILRLTQSMHWSHRWHRIPP